MDLTVTSFKGQGSVHMIKAVWILLDIGPCLYRYSTEKRFLETDENLFSGFFVALETFAKSIGSEEVLKVELRDLVLWFMKGTNVVFVVGSDRNEDVSETLLKVSQAFNEAAPELHASSYNPLISSDVMELERRIDFKIRQIVLKAELPAPQVEALAEEVDRVKDATSAALHRTHVSKQPTLTMEVLHRTEEDATRQRKPKILQQEMKVTGEMIPRLEKPLTDALRQRERLVKHFGVTAVDILHLADGKLTVNEIAAASTTERSTIEDVLSFAQKLGIVEFKTRPNTSRSQLC
jgi:hypothetical protein